MNIDNLITRDNLEFFNLPPSGSTIKERRVVTIEGVMCSFVRTEEDLWYMETPIHNIIKAVENVDGLPMISCVESQPIIKDHLIIDHVKGLPIGNWEFIKYLKIYLKKGYKIPFLVEKTVMVPFVLAMFCDEPFKCHFEDYKRTNFETSWKYDPAYDLKPNSLTNSKALSDYMINYLNVLKKKLPNLTVPLETQTEYSDAEMDFVALMLSTCAVQKFTNDQAYFNTLAKTRLTAYFNQVNVIPKDPDAILSKLDRYSYLTISILMPHYPKLKLKMYTYLINEDSGELGRYAKIILSKSQATIYTLIADHMLYGVLSKAHFSQNVIPEANDFVRAHEDLKSILKDKYMFVKLLMPDNKIIENSRWPILAGMAVLTMFCRLSKHWTRPKFLNRKSIVNVITPVMMEDMASPLNESHYTENRPIYDPNSYMGHTITPGTLSALDEDVLASISYALVEMHEPLNT